MDFPLHFTTSPFWQLLHYRTMSLSIVRAMWLWLVPAWHLDASYFVWLVYPFSAKGNPANRSNKTPMTQTCAITQRQSTPNSITFSFCCLGVWLTTTLRRCPKMSSRAWKLWPKCELSLSFSKEAHLRHRNVAFKKIYFLIYIFLLLQTFLWIIV